MISPETMGGSRLGESAMENGDKGLTWESRLALWLPGPPIVGAVIIAVTLIGAQRSVHWYLELDVHPLASFLMLMIAYIMMVPRFFALRLADELRQFGLDVPVSGRKETEVWALGFPVDAIRRSRLGGAVGVLVFLGIDIGVAYIEEAQFPAFFTTFHEGTITLFTCVMIGWLMGRGSYFSFACPTALPLPRASDIDLLHLETLYAMGRSGVARRPVLAGRHVDRQPVLPEIRPRSVGRLPRLRHRPRARLVRARGRCLGLWGVFPAFGIGLVLGLIELLKPAGKVRRLIQVAKRNELERLEPQIKQARDEAMKDDTSTQGRLTDLLTYQDRIQATAEWPFDSSTLMRFGLYLLIPVGSMIGGALVERVVNLMLD